MIDEILRAGLPHNQQINLLVSRHFCISLQFAMRLSLPLFFAFLAAAVTSTVAAPMPADSLQQIEVSLPSSGSAVHTDFTPATGQRH
jgi:hypothetical protein